MNTSSILTVGEGRGFVVRYQRKFLERYEEDQVLIHEDKRLIITADHCLPELPDQYSEPYIYWNLLAPLGSSPSVCCECLFVNPIADIAILGSPDEQERISEAYQSLLESLEPIPIGEAPEKGQAWLMSLVGQWFECTVEYIRDGPLWVSNAVQPIEGGMSGSPILSPDGAAIGLLSNANFPSNNQDEYGTDNPRLHRDLPAWLLKPETTPEPRVRAKYT